MPRMAAHDRKRLTAFVCLFCLCGCLTNPGFSPVGGGNVLSPGRIGYSGSLPYESSGVTSVPVSNPLVSNGGLNSTGEFSSRNDLVPNSTPDQNGPQNLPRNTISSPDLGHIYGRTAQTDDRDRNPVIVIPGVLGSRLVDNVTRRVVWGEFGGDGIDPSSMDGAQLIALPMSEGRSLDTLKDRVKTAGTLDAFDVRIFGFPFQINAYRDLLSALGVGGYRDDQTNLADFNYGEQSYSSFQFAYDWRRDNVENARLLHKFILEKKAYVEAERQKRYGNDFEPVRFDIVAHSMGGLIARYYLEYGEADLPADGSTPTPTWSGARNVDHVIMVATPNAGSLDAIQNLVQGETLSRFLPRYEAAILGTMPALYQLLPRSRQRPVIAEGDRNAVDHMDPRVWAQFRWGLMDPRQQAVLQYLLPDVPDPNVRQKIAYEHLTKCLDRARAFHAALDVPAKPPEGTTIHLIAGDAHPTTTQFRVDNRGVLTVSARQPGDGRVSRPSALMDERFSAGVKWTPRLVTPITWSSVNFLFADHLGLTSDPGFTDNILYLLLESPR